MKPYKTNYDRRWKIVENDDFIMITDGVHRIFQTAKFLRHVVEVHNKAIDAETEEYVRGFLKKEGYPK